MKAFLHRAGSHLWGSIGIAWQLDTKQVLGSSSHVLGRWLGDQKSTTEAGPLDSDAEGSPDHVLRNAGWGTTQEKTQPQPLNIIRLAYLTSNLTGATGCTVVGLADGEKST